RALLAWGAATIAASLAATLIVATPLCAAAVPAPAFDAAFQQFQRASTGGDEQTIESAADQFAKLAATEPGDPLLLAYSGAATAMRARTTVLPWRRLAFADDGLAQLDKALTLL